MNLGSSIRSGTLWLFTGNISQRALEFIFGIILARILLPSDFGLLVMTQVFTGFAGFIAGGGMGQALIQSKEITPKHYHVVFTLQLLICSSIYCFFFFSAPFFAIWLNNPIYNDLLRISALNFIIRPFVNISRSKLSREMRFKSISIISLISMVISSVLSIYLAKLNYGVWSLIYGGLISSVFSAFCFIWHSKSYPRFAFDKSIAQKLGSYGIKFSINDIIEYLRDQTPNFLIGKLLGPNLVGLFNKGTSLSKIPISTIGGSAYQTVFRALSSTQDNLDKCKYIYLRTITLVAVYTAPFYICLFWMAEPLITFLYGEKWALASISLQIYSFVGLLRCISNPSGAVMAAFNKLGVEIKIQIITLMLAVTGCFWGIQQNELFYIALGIIPSFVFLAVAMSYFALKSIQANFIDLVKALMPACILNTFLAVMFFIADKSYVTFMEPLYKSEFTYLSFIGTMGFLTYSVLFLYMPITALNNESDRWRIKFRLMESKNV